MGAGKGGLSPAAVYSPANLSGSDKLMLLGAMLKDAGSPDGPSNVMATTQLLGQRQQMQMARQALQGWMGGQGGPPSAASISSALPPAPVMQGPGMDGAPIGQRPLPTAGPSPSGPPSGPVSGTPGGGDMMRNIALSVMGGFDPTPFIKGMEFNQPHYGMASGGYTMNDKTGSAGPVQFPNPQYLNGYKVDPNSPNAPTYVPMPVVGTIPDGKGGLIPQAGYAEAVQAAKAAETAGQQGATYADVPQSDGTTARMTNAEYAARRGGGDAPVAAGSPGGPTIGPAGSGTPPPSAASISAQLPKPNGAPVLGVTQSPAAGAYAKARAESQAAQDVAQPKAAYTQDAQSRHAMFLRGLLTKAMGQVGPWTAGAGGVLQSIPLTPAHDLEQTLATINANTAMEKLAEFKDQSANGSGPMRLSTQREFDSIQKLNGSLDQTQSPAQIKENLQRAVDDLDAAEAGRVKAWNDTYGGAPPTAATPASMGDGQRSAPQQRGAPAASDPAYRATLAAEIAKRGLLRGRR